MSGLEVPAFLIGLSGLIPLVEKSLELWKGLAEAKEFGSELVRIVAMLAIEYHRFLSWARFLQPPPTSTSVPKSSSAVKSQPPLDFPFSEDLGSQLQAPIESAAARVVTILGEISDIAEKYKLKGNTNPAPSSPFSGKSTSVAVGLSTVLPLVGAKHNRNITSLIVKNRDLGKALQEKTSFRQRFTFTSKPWGEPDQKALENKVGELSYWNDRLEGLLPATIQQSLSHQAVLSQILVDENRTLLDTLIKAADHQNEAVKAHATLWKERIDFLSVSQGDNTALEKYRRSASTLSAVPGSGSSRCELSLTTFREGQNPPTLAAVEWYPFGDLTWSSNDITIATSRLAQIAHLCSVDDRPSSLRILDGICFVEKADSLGLVSRLPKGASTSKQPISLYSLLEKVPDIVAGFQPPSLEQRLLLAQQLASSIYSFGLVRWYHKDFNSRNVVFFRDNSSSANIMLDSPHVTGFSISRPDNNTEKSLNKDLEARAIYLHSDLRIADPEKRPRYHFKYELYSLGLLLFEIGVWNKIDRVVKSSLSPDHFKAKVIDRCTKDLGFFVGTRYRDIVVQCLTTADQYADESDSLLDMMYWSVVLELAKCR